MGADDMRPSLADARHDPQMCRVLPNQARTARVPRGLGIVAPQDF